MSDKVITTSRTFWRTLSMHTDIAAIYRQFSDPDMCVYYDEPPCTLAETQDIITHYTTHAESAGYRRYGVCHATSGEFIGTCGYHFLNRNEGSVEIGYDVWKEFWQQGYASEMLTPLLQICFAVTEVTLVYAVIDPRNRASIAVVRRAGFVQIPPVPRIVGTQLAVYGLYRRQFIQ